MRRMTPRGFEVKHFTGVPDCREAATGGMQEKMQAGARNEVSSLAF
jgi:hypothetical protein